MADKDVRAPSALQLETNAIATIEAKIVIWKVLRRRDRFISSRDRIEDSQAYKENKKGSSEIEHLLLVLEHPRSVIRS